MNIDSTLEGIRATDFANAAAIVVTLDKAQVRFVSDDFDAVKATASTQNYEAVSLDDLPTSDNSLIYLVKLSAEFCSDPDNNNRIVELLKGKHHVTMLNYQKPAQGQNGNGFRDLLDTLADSCPLNGLITTQIKDLEVSLSGLPKNLANLSVGPLKSIKVKEEKTKWTVEGKLNYYGVSLEKLVLDVSPSVFDAMTSFVPKAKAVYVAGIVIKNYAWMYKDWCRENLAYKRGDGSYTSNEEDPSDDGDGEYRLPHQPPRIHDLTFRDDMNLLVLQGQSIENINVKKFLQQDYNTPSRSSIDPFGSNYNGFQARLVLDVVPAGLGSSLPDLPRPPIKNVSFPPKSVIKLFINAKFPIIEDFHAPDCTLILDCGAVFSDDFDMYEGLEKFKDFKFLQQVDTLVIQHLDALYMLCHARHDLFKTIKHFHLVLYDKADGVAYALWRDKKLNFSSLESLHLTAPREVCSTAPQWMMPKLKSLKLEDTRQCNVNRSTLKDVIKKHPNIEHLELISADYPYDDSDYADDIDRDDDDLFEIMRMVNPSASKARKTMLTLPKLKSLKMMGTSEKCWDPSTFSFPALESLEIEGPINGTFVIDAPRLKHVKLVTGLGHATVTVVNLPELERLEIGGFTKGSLGPGCSAGVEIVVTKERAYSAFAW